MREINEKLNQENAAKTIQRFWRSLPRGKDINLYTKQFKSASKEDIRNGKYDKEIFRCIRHCAVRDNKIGLQKIAYSLFSGDMVNNTTEKLIELQ